MTGNEVVNNTNPWMFISILWLFSLTAFWPGRDGVPDSKTGLSSARLERDWARSASVVIIRRGEIDHVQMHCTAVAGVGGFGIGMG